MINDYSPDTEGLEAGLPLLFSLSAGTVALGVATANLDTAGNATCLKNEWPGLDGREQAVWGQWYMISHLMSVS